MKKIDEINKKVKEIYEELKELEASMETEKSKEIDFNYFKGAAKQNAFKNHILTNANEYIQKNYLYLLSSLLMFNNPDEIKHSQIMYISRLIEGFSNKNLDIENIYSHTIIMNGVQISDCIEAIKDYKDVFVVDSLICANIKGRANDQILEYLSEIYFILGITFDEFKNLIDLCNYIFEKNKERILSSKVEDLNIFKHHLNYIMESKILYDFTKLDTKDKDNIIILNSNINLKELNKLSDIEVKDDCFNVFSLEELGLKEKVINLDKYSFKSIKFINCKFDGIAIIISKTKKVEFDNCEFENMKDYFFAGYFKYMVPIDIKNGKLKNCKLKNCKTKNELLYVADSELENIEFNNCRAEENMILCERSKIENIYFDNCNLEGPSVTSCKYILNLKNSYIKNVKISAVYAERSDGVINLANSDLENLLIENVEIKQSGGRDGLIYAENSNLVDTILKNCKIGLERYQNGNLMYLKNSKSINHKFIDCRYSNYAIREAD